MWLATTRQNLPYGLRIRPGRYMEFHPEALKVEKLLIKKENKL